VVNVAARLESMNKDYGTLVLVSEATRNAAGPCVSYEFRGEAAVRGRREPMPVYSVEIDAAPPAEKKPAVILAAKPA